ncbi:TadE/TadG family type IV pilus assembly protein [Massilia sp. CF038]|uniref:TadE/TadG family type IV pilus assembly protein n=1 Tax=Massilia sp. CF038 TaxID=1881045 RepID=UPI00091BD60A|nr:pilus assembly protein TadG-related protein [Massilia sp. CF038]SHH40813.1 Putative Flp pilus-assembly TadE/G-like [Massilia sp. CF038]
MSTPHQPRRRIRRQRGAFGVIYAIILPVMLGMVGLAIDLSMMYARGHELQAIADSAALAAARALDGTPDGLARAKENARTTARTAEYRFLRPETIDWTSSALSVGPTRDGPWTLADSANGSDLPNMLFARVDTGALDERYGRVAIAFLRVVGVAGEQHLARRAVAGRKESSIGPVAVCALSQSPLAMRSNAPAANAEEAVEYGFRRGVGYNLLNLNSHGNTARSFIVNPLDFPPAPARVSHQSDDALRPFVCTGHMPAPRIEGGSSLYVREPFPVSMVRELNARFASFNGGSVCTRYGAPPDSNVIDFRGPYGGFYISGAPTPLNGSAASYFAQGKLFTVADADVLPPGTTAASYGTLWSFGRPVRYAGGALGAPFTRNDWSKLYPVTAGAALSSNYTFADSPYERGLSPHRQSPVGMSGITKRRVLNVPLLDCPVSGGSARVLAIGRFLMTTPATESPPAIHAEFGGLTTYGELAASAVLYK